MLKCWLLLCRWPAMGIHGDKSQQERDWVLNGKLTLIVWNLHGEHELQIWASQSFHFPEFKFGKAPILIATDVASRGLGQYNPLHSFCTFVVYQKESIFAFCNSSASLWVSSLTWRSSLCGRALAWQAQVPRGGRRILGGVRTGEARVSQSSRCTEVTRPKCSITRWPAKNRGGRVEGWPQFLPPNAGVFSGNGLDCFTHPGSWLSHLSWSLACVFGHCKSLCYGVFC